MASVLNFRVSNAISPFIACLHLKTPYWWFMRFSFPSSQAFLPAFGIFWFNKMVSFICCSCFQSWSFRQQRLGTGLWIPLKMKRFLECIEAAPETVCQCLPQLPSKPSWVSTKLRKLKWLPFWKLRKGSNSNRNTGWCWHDNKSRKTKPGLREEPLPYNSLPQFATITQIFFCTEMYRTYTNCHWDPVARTNADTKIDSAGELYGRWRSPQEVAAEVLAEWMVMQQRLQELKGDTDPVTFCRNKCQMRAMLHNISMHFINVLLVATVTASIISTAFCTWLLQSDNDNDEDEDEISETGNDSLKNSSLQSWSRPSATDFFSSSDGLGHLNLGEARHVGWWADVGLWVINIAAPQKVSKSKKSQFWQAIRTHVVLSWGYCASHLKLWMESDWGHFFTSFWRT